MEPTVGPEQRAQVRTELRRVHVNFIPKRPDPDVHRELKRGWILPYLEQMDGMLWGRWQYWMDALERQAVPAEPIPRIEWEEDPKRTPALTVWKASLDCVPRHGTWGDWDHVRYLLRWLLYGFGSILQEEPPTEPFGCEGASDRLYQVFCLGALQLWPHDYLGDLLAESSYGKHNGFFPTPMHLVQFLTKMTCGEYRGGELLTSRICDPCLGTGRFLLDASNYSLCLYGMDIDETMVLASVVNAYVYAPWMALPLPFTRSEPETALGVRMQVTKTGQGVMEL
jgi:hypothetical protein